MADEKILDRSLGCFICFCGGNQRVLAGLCGFHFGGHRFLPAPCRAALGRLPEQKQKTGKVHPDLICGFSCCDHDPCDRYLPDGEQREKSGQIDGYAFNSVRCTYDVLQGLALELVRLGLLAKRQFCGQKTLKIAVLPAVERRSPLPVYRFCRIPRFGGGINGHNGIRCRGKFQIGGFYDISNYYGYLLRLSAAYV